MIGSKEFEGSKGQLVIPVADFDNRLKTDLELKEKIAGFSSVSLHHIEKGIIAEHYSLPTFSYDYHIGRPVTYIGLHPDVYREVFGEDPLYDDLEEVMVANRVYGKDGAVVEYVLGQPYAPRQSDITSLTSISGDITMMVDKTRSMRESELRGKKFPTFFGSFERDKATLDMIYKIIPNKEALVDALIALRETSGVQLIFGDKNKLVDFLKRCKARPEDDCAASIHSSVPARLVLAVLPLGEYERKKLMKTT